MIGLLKRLLNNNMLKSKQYGFCQVLRVGGCSGLFRVVPGGCVACGGFPGGFLPCFGRFARSVKIADEKIKIVSFLLTIFNIFFIKMLAFYGVIWYNIDS